MNPNSMTELALLEAIKAFQSPLKIARSLSAQPSAVKFFTTSEFTDQQMNGYVTIADLPGISMEHLGSRRFLEVHGARFPYVVGEMANGIATAEMVIAAVKSGLIGFFGAAGLLPSIVEKNLDIITSNVPVGAINWGSNLIHSPNEPAIEEAIVNLYLRRGVHRVSASA